MRQPDAPLLRLTLPAPNIGHTRAGRAKNPMLNSNRLKSMHHQEHARIAAIWRAYGKTLATGMTELETPVRSVIYLFMPTRRKIDPNNYWPTFKPLFDGFVEAGLLEDDNHEHLLGPDMRWGGVAGNKWPHLVIEFYPAPPEPTPTLNI